jgi:hypothetical protein
MNVTDAFVSVTEPDNTDNTDNSDNTDNTARVWRVVVVPSLWAPLHHVAAVTSLAAFVATVRPDAVVFLNTPDERSRQPQGAFIDVLAGFRAGYAGPIGVYGYPGHPEHDGEHDAALLARLRVTVLADRAPIVAGWLATSDDLATDPDPIARAETTDANLVCGATGRLRLTGRARPATDGTVHAWLVFECGTLAADRAAGTLGFGVLEATSRTIGARPIRVGADGGFTFNGTRYKAQADAHSTAVRTPAPPDRRRCGA